MFSLLLTVPLWVLVSFMFEPTNENWSHLAETLLPEYIINSLWLMLGVTVGTLLLGIPTAWVISQYQFFGKSILHWALLLPMAMPAYIIAYTYTGLLEFEGPVQTALRTLFETQTVNLWFPEVRSLGGAVVMFSLVLYPYVYLLARTSFANQSQSVMQASRTLGAGPFKTFFKVALPIARPAIIAGLTLALMETLADFGTVQYFGVPTFTTGIYRTWSGFGDTTTAAQLSILLLLFVVTLMVIEAWSRKQAKYFTGNAQPLHQALPKLKGTHALTAFSICLFPILFGFILPALQLLDWSINVASTELNAEFLTLVWNSFSLAFITALVAVSIALLFLYIKRLHNNPMINQSVRIAGLGYAIPGTVIAVAVIIPFAWLDNTLDSWTREQLGFSTGLLLSGTLFALVFAYCFRFLSVALQSIQSGLSQIKPSMDESAKTLGANHWTILKRIHIPLLSSSLVTAFILVFVEVLKELPTTLILRPFNFNTLAVRAYEMAADERLADAGLPALLIVITGLIPVIILSKMIGKRHA
ncbi:Ferric iron ABC transporter, permease protein [hydrothermal vent metagenome]|uniref:Ferric iron ABC transporter, permease protein n=1 Tax=hydrothermal vent metagenome TaxID=652676 RepID=A0A3B0VVR8_9ZZZZ